MEIKEAAEEHIPGITRLWMEYMYFNSHIEPYNTNHDNVLDRVESHLRNAINSDNFLVLIALDNSLPVGYSISSIMRRKSPRKTKTFGVIHVITITADYHGKGIGRQMVERTKEWFTSLGADQVETNTVTQHSTADSFWQKQGFKDHEKVL